MILFYKNIEIPIRDMQIDKKTDLESSKFKAFREFWLDQIDKEGAENTYQYFKKENMKEVYGKRHLNAHIFGELLFQKMGPDGMAICDTTFTFGCYHGVILYAIASQGSAILPTLNTICIKKNGPSETGCRHGIGHGILDYLGSNKIIDALNLCNTFQTTALFGCTQGVFMEYNNPAIFEDGTMVKSSTRVLNPEKPMEPCTSVPELYRPSCYFEIGEWWDEVFHKDYKKLGDLCGLLDNVDENAACFLGIGRSIGEMNNYDPSLVKICDQMPGETESLYCRAGLYWIFSMNMEKKSLAPSFCSELTQEQQKRCLENVNLLLIIK